MAYCHLKRYALNSLYGTVPSAAPTGFHAEAGERQVIFSWFPPPLTKQNGVITSYTLSCVPSPSTLPQSPFHSGSLTVTGFGPDTAYSCSLVATNRRGSGPAATTNFTTQPECESSVIYNNTLLYMLLLLILSCLLQIHTSKYVFTELWLVLN